MIYHEEVILYRCTLNDSTAVAWIVENKFYGPIDGPIEATVIFQRLKSMVNKTTVRLVAIYGASCTMEVQRIVETSSRLSCTVARFNFVLSIGGHIVTRTMDTSRSGLESFKSLLSAAANQ